MNQEEIEEIKIAVAQEATEKIDPTEDSAIADMAEGAGWRLMMKKANKIIVALLEPVDSSDITSEANLALIGANTLANAKAIKVLREFINQAESVKNAKRIMAKQEESKQATQ